MTWLIIVALSLILPTMLVVFFHEKRLFLDLASYRCGNVSSYCVSFVELQGAQDCLYHCCCCRCWDVVSPLTLTYSQMSHHLIYQQHATATIRGRSPRRLPWDRFADTFMPCTSTQQVPNNHVSDCWWKRWLRLCPLYLRTLQSGWYITCWTQELFSSMSTGVLLSRTWVTSSTTLDAIGLSVQQLR